MNTQTLSRPATPRGKMPAPKVDHDKDAWDISGIWNAEVDPGADAEVVAHFDHNWDGEQNNPSLAGLSVTEFDVTLHYHAGGAMDWLGLECVMRLEAAYSEELSA